MSVIASVSRVLQALGIPYALIGARAVAARGHPRMTLDYDFLAADDRVLALETWHSLIAAGATVDLRRGDFDDPIAGVARVEFPDGVEADVLLARWKWEREVIERSEPLDLGDAVVPVPITSDLILLKLSAGGPIDLQDVVALMASDPERLIEEVEGKIDGVVPEVTTLWKRVKTSMHDGR